MAAGKPAPFPTVDDDAAMRRMPTQKRSRDRVEHILGCASRLIAERGSDTMRMSEVAELSGISIGSLYQYFPDKAAIIRTLAERYNSVSRACIADGLSHVRTVEDLRQAFLALIEEYYAIFLAEPVIRDIWSAMQADKALRDIELAESRENAALLAAALKRALPDQDLEKLRVSALLVMYFGECVMRLAISTGETEGRALVDAYKHMAYQSFIPA
ncbi:MULTISPECIES: TetR/AcrR family transcriptional regulator [unclassified Rhizobium]|uniref:TetR/AcrR family transcriptional regulator n=1 Tax=unclassified Rhizobium TaxID=2613769 RepID=UPI0007150FBB|nr:MULTISPECIES: TetR/AcrR family transcriptional regulator [unclassified Rhizobium]KQS88696.1 TetR family transcriptional regulator [Rhizobium sp. Leaf391]KQT05639.1 TetR family transcriptional regulator [Rhizobium sp. Leaf386]KQT91363.1 TetR family transcriptional regulator [Rhizobium sp. Leaf453]